jgi:hypothetical protein
MILGCAAEGVFFISPENGRTLPKFWEFKKKI